MHDQIIESSCQNHAVFIAPPLQERVMFSAFSYPNSLAPQALSKDPGLVMTPSTL